MVITPLTYTSNIYITSPSSRDHTYLHPLGEDHEFCSGSPWCQRGRSLVCTGWWWCLLHWFACSGCCCVCSGPRLNRRVAWGLQDLVMSRQWWIPLFVVFCSRVRVIENIEIRPLDIFSSYIFFDLFHLWSYDFFFLSDYASLSMYKNSLG
jgi:hypothetical protein